MLGLGLAFSACSTPQPRATSDEKRESKPEQELEGNASWYGSRFQGRKTSSGERFDAEKLTAAHRNLPFGTRVRVTRIQNGKSVVVRVNDRGPADKNRLIDLSRSAARALGFIQQGMARVRIEVLSAED